VPVLEIFVQPWLLGPVNNIFFLAVHYFNSFVPIAQQVEQAAVLGHLSPMTNPTPLGISKPITFTLG
jgi:hypothetical protein